MNTKEIIDGYLGNTQVNSIYQGSELIWYRFDINLFAYGVKQDLSGDGKTLTRVGNMELHKTLPIQSKMRGCLLNDDGTVNYYLSNDSDLLKEDGITPSILNGTDGNVMTEIPAFYVLEKDEGGFAYRYISETQLPGFRYIPKQYIGRYEAAINRDTGKLMSIINNSTTYRGGNNTSYWDGTNTSLLGRPCTNQSRSIYRTGARMGRSSKWNISTTLTDYTIQLLFITEYATYNSQAAFNNSLTAEGYKQGGLGAGVTNLDGTSWSSYNNYNPFIPCGYTTDLGNRTGVKNYNNGTLSTQVNRYRGIELPFGHIAKHRDGCVIELSNNYTIAKYYIYDNPDNYADIKTANARYLCDIPSQNGYTKRFNKYTNIPSTLGGSSGSWSYDYINIKNNGAGTLRGFLSGGSTADDSVAGLGWSYVTNSPAVAYVAMGARLTYCDENIIIQTVDIPIVSLVITGGTEVDTGNTLQLGIAYTPSNTTQQGVMWSSSDETKATVDSNGLVTAIADGSVVIRATSIVNSAISDTYSLETTPVELISLTINGDVSTLEATTTTQLGISYNPLNTTEVGVVWTSSDETKATVDSNGLVTGVSVGNVIITATSIVNSSISDTYSLEIAPEVIELVSLEITGDIEVNRGNTLQLGISYNPLNTTEVGVVWSSSDETKATVDSNGLVTTISEGNVIITATSTINGAISDTYSLEITSEFAYGVKQDLSGDGKTLIRVGNLELHKTLPIQSQMRGCLLNDNGTVNYYLSNDSDLLKEDGVTPSVLDGTDGNVMTEIPSFYVLEKDEGGFAYTYISEVQLPGFKYIPKQYIGRYEAVINRSTGKLMSIINNSTTYRGGNNTSAWDIHYRSLLGKPCTNQSRSTYRTGARMNRSSKWNISTTLSDYTIQLLFIIEYATYNSQAAFNSSLTAEGYKQGGLGVGVSNINYATWTNYNNNNPFIPCGYTADLGNRTGIKDFVMPPQYGTLTTQVNRYRGIEIPFGHIYKHRDGCVIELSNNYTIAKYYIFDNPDNYADTKTANARYLCDISSQDGFIKRFNRYTNIPSTIGGSSTSWSYDYISIKYDEQGTLRGLRSGESAHQPSTTGLGYSNANYPPTYVSVHTGARLTYCNENIIIETS